MAGRDDRQPPDGSLEVTVRHAGAPDRPFVAALEPDLAPARRTRAVTIDRVLLAEHRGGAVGYLRFEYLGGRVPFLVTVRITPAAQGRGVGHALLGRLEEELRREGHGHLVSSAPEGQEAATRWHEREGFVRCGRVEGLYPDSPAEVFFRKGL